MDTAQIYSTITDNDITIMVPLTKPFWNPILWTSQSVDMKIFAYIEVHSVIWELQQFDNCCEHIKNIDLNKQPNDDELEKLKNFLSKKENFEKIKEYFLKSSEYTLITCVYKHYDILTQNLPENHKLLAVFGMINSRNTINLRILGEDCKINFGSNGNSTIQYYAETNTPEIIEEMLLKIAPLESV